MLGALGDNRYVERQAVEGCALTVEIEATVPGPDSHGGTVANTALRFLFSLATSSIANRLEKGLRAALAVTERCVRARCVTGAVTRECQDGVVSSVGASDPGAGMTASTTAAWCPACESHDLVPVVYGMPDLDAFEAAERGEVIIGGCMPLLSGDVIGCPHCRWTGVRRRGRFIPLREAERIAALDPDEPDIVRNRAALLALNESPTLRRLAETCEAVSLDGDLTLTPHPAPFGAGIHLLYTAGWYDEYVYEHELYYPFTDREFWTVIDDLGDVVRFDMDRGGLQDSIAMIEGFPVLIEDLNVATPTSRPLSIGGYIHELPDYPYVRAMPDRCTVAEWRTRRFEPHYPGFVANVVDDDSIGAAPLDDDLTLREARGKPSPTRRTSRD
jgi:hypothetical protein